LLQVGQSLDLDKNAGFLGSFGMVRFGGRAGTGATCGSGALLGAPSAETTGTFATLTVPYWLV
jgi:hypothetical protein